MAIWSRIALQIPKVLREVAKIKGVDKSLIKGMVRKRLSEKPEFANNQKSFFKPRPEGGKGSRSTYATTFDDAWNSDIVVEELKKLKIKRAYPGEITGKHAGNWRYNKSTKKWERFMTEESKSKISEFMNKPSAARDRAMANLLKRQGKRRTTGVDRKYIPQLDAYVDSFLNKNIPVEYLPQQRGIHEVMEQALRRDKQRGILDIAFGKGTQSQKDIKEAQFLKQFKKNISDEEFMQPYLTEAGPLRKKAQRFFDDPDKFRALSTDEGYAEVVRNYLRSRGYTDNQINMLFPPNFATTGHIPPVKESYADFLKFGTKSSLEAFEQSANPKMWNPEFGLANKAKATPDFWTIKAMQDDLMSPEGLKQMSRMYDAFGIQSLIRGKTIGKHNLERQAKLIDWATATPYETKLFTGRPETGDVDKVRNMFKRMLERGDITYEEIFAAIHKGKYPGYNKGGVVNGYAAGGIGKLGINILKKLSNKMPEEDFLRVMETLWKGVDPKKSGRYKAWAKDRWSPGYKWPYKKSRIKGPGMKQSHYASLSDQAKDDLRKRYRKRIEEYIKRKRQDEEFYRHSEFWPNWPKKD